MFHSADFAADARATAEKIVPLRPRGVEPEGPGLLRRPRLLSRAAREGARIYKRERDLQNALPGAAGPRRGRDIVSRLLSIEAQIEADRRAHAAGYSPTRHVQVLSALVAEALALRAGDDAQTA